MGFNVCMLWIQWLCVMRRAVHRTLTSVPTKKRLFFFVCFFPFPSSLLIGSNCITFFNETLWNSVTHTHTPVVLPLSRGMGPLKHVFSTQVPCVEHVGHSFFFSWLRGERHMIKLTPDLRQMTLHAFLVLLNLPLFRGSDRLVTDVYKAFAGRSRLNWRYFIFRRVESPKPCYLLSKVLLA